MLNEAKRDYLFLIWKDPNSRRNFTVGKLTRGEKFRFEYCEEYQEAVKSGWKGLTAFPDMNGVYESENLFPAFSSRLPDPKRRDMEKILEKYGLESYDAYELLKKSGARLPIDTYEFIDPILPEDETVQRDFFVMGIRHNAPCKGEDCGLLPAVEKGDLLKFQPEPDNPYDPNAIMIMTESGEQLGYVPRYFSPQILARLERGDGYSCRVLEVGSNHDCTECVKVRLNIPAV